MLSKCANPSCSTLLVYLREGKLFVVESSDVPYVASPTQPKKLNRVEHFWLCGICSAEMTLIFDRDAGVQIVSKAQPPNKVLAAAS